MLNSAVRKVPLSAPQRRFQDKNLLAEINEFVKEGPYLNGLHVPKFEVEFASYVGTNFCVGVSSGTSALELAISVLDLPVGSFVLAPANAGGYASVAIQRNGFGCAYYDVDGNGLPSVELLETVRNPSTLAVVITHLYGQSAEMNSITNWAKAHNIQIIEDCAQAAGAILKDSKVGSFGILSTFSFYPTKNLGAIGDAGAICTNDQVLAERLKRRRQYGWETRYVSIERGSNLRMDEVQALVLRRELEKLDRYNSVRRSIWKQYYDCLKSFGLETKLLGADNPSFVAHLCVIKTNLRREVVALLAKYGISTDIHYPVPDYLQPTFSFAESSHLSETESLCNSVLSIPLFETLTSDEIEIVLTGLNHLCKSGILAK